MFTDLHITYGIKITMVESFRLTPIASEAVYTRNFFSDRMSDSM